MDSHEMPTDVHIATASGEDDALRTAIHAVARSCEPDSIDALMVLLRRLNVAAPRHIAMCPVVAFIRYGQADGAAQGRGVAITRNGDRYNVHTVFWDESSGRWEGSNGRYGVPWEAARVEMNRRADGEPRP